jgi:hypothetical protein
MTDDFSDKILTGITDEVSHTCDIIDRLENEGYIYQFVLQGRALFCLQNQAIYHQLDFDVQEIFSVDGGITNNGITIFALQHREDNLKGVFVAI